MFRHFSITRLRHKCSIVMMKNKFDNFKRLVTPQDFIAIFGVIVGILIAIFMQDIAMKLIGLCVTILCGVALFMLISQRLNGIIDTRFKRSPASEREFTMTVVKESAAVRQTVEDFDSTFGPDDTGGKKPEKKTEFHLFNPEKSGSSKTASNEFLEDFSGVKILDPNAMIDYAPIAEKERSTAAPTAPETDAPLESKDNTETEDNKLSSNTASSNESSAFGDEIIDDQIDVANAAESASRSELSMNGSVANDSESETLVDSAEPEEITPEETLANVVLVEEGEPLNEAMAEDVIPGLRHKETVGGENMEAPLSEPIEQEPAHEAAPYKEQMFDFPVAALMEDESAFGDEPKKEFEYFISRIMMVIRSVTNTQTSVFLLLNREREELAIEGYVTTKPQAMTSGKKIKLGVDIISQIAQHGKPEILTEINPSALLDLIPYYAEPTEVSSFIGVPVFYDSTVIGILCADSAENDAYDSFTVNFLGHFTKIISALVANYTEKFDLIQSSKTLQALTHFLSLAEQSGYDVKSVSAAIAESVKSHFDYSTVGVCAYDSAEGRWIIAAHSSDKPAPGIVVGSAVDLEQAYIGHSIISKKTVVISPVRSNDTRVTLGEPDIAGGYFISTPLKSINTTYGAIYVEGKDRSGITSGDIDTLENLGSQAGAMLENLYYMNALQSSAIYDDVAGAHNYRSFNIRLNEEIRRTAQLGYNSALCLVRLDYYSTLDPAQYPDRHERALRFLLSMINESKREFDIVGQYDESTFAIILPQIDLSFAHIWAEKLRSQVAAAIIELFGHRFSLTVSIGMTRFDRDDSIQTALENARKALEISLKKTNALNFFS